MAIFKREINQTQKIVLLSAEESHFLDFKSKEIMPSKLSESISAFANSDGGELFIGISEDKINKKRLWQGFENLESANQYIALFESLFPLGQDFNYVFLEAHDESGLVLKVEILKTREIKKASDGHIYIRRSAQKLRITDSDKIRQLEYAKGINSFESNTIEVPLNLITNSEPIIEFMLNVVPSNEPQAWLEKQQLIKLGKPTVGGILLFSEEPQAILPKRSGIKVYRYRTKDEPSRETLSFVPKTIEGHLYKQINESVDLTISFVEEGMKLGVESLEAISYPKEALHEIITNAVLHRDYSITDDIHIRIFDNRIEIESPGRLPAHITPKNILTERFARNGSIVRLINKYPDPPNKDVGEGLNTAFNAMNKIGLKNPLILERENSVLVVIRHEKLASPEIIILEYLEKNDFIKNKIAREICHVSADYVIKELFGRLVKRGYIEVIPGTRTSATAYRKTSKFLGWRGEVSDKGAHLE